MASRNQTIKIKLISYTKQFRKRMKDSGSAIEKFVGKTKLLSAGLIAGSAAFSVFSGAILLVGAAFGAVGSSIPKLQKYFDIGKDAGLSAEQFQVWAGAAQRAGVEIGRLGPILRFTDARIRQFRNGQGELASSLKKASQETQAYFEQMKGLSNDKFLDKIEGFFSSTATEADKSTVAVGLWTENAGLMLRAVNQLKGTRVTLENGNLLLTQEETDNVKSAAVALQDMRRETEIIKDRAVAANVNSYIAAQSGLEELRRKWYSLLSLVGETAVKLAQGVGLLDPNDLVSTVDRMGSSYAAILKSESAERELAARDQHRINTLLKSNVESELEKVTAVRLVSTAKRESLGIEKALAEALQNRDDAEKQLEKSKAAGAFKWAIEGAQIRLKNDQQEVDWLYKKLELYTRVKDHFNEQIKAWEKLNNPVVVPDGETGYYAEIINQSRAALKARVDATAALKRLREERGKNKISLDVYRQSEAALLKILKGGERYYERIIRLAKEKTTTTQDAEDALFRLNEEFQKGTIKSAEFIVAQQQLNTVLGMTSEGLKEQLSPMERVLAKLGEYKKRIKDTAAEAAAAQKLLDEGGLTPAQYEELFAPAEGSKGEPTKQNKLIWQLDSKEQTELFLRDFQSFSGELSEAMLDAETDWDKFWLNMIKRMNQRNLARYINDAFSKMITTLQGSNKKVVDETKAMTENIKNATGGASGAGGFGWGGLIGGLATLGSAYILSRNMNNASGGAGGGAGGDVEVVVNINNSTRSDVRYDGRTLTETGGIKRTVIDIIVEDYSNGGTLREVLG